MQQIIHVKPVVHHAKHVVDLLQHVRVAQINIVKFFFLIILILS